MIEALRGRAANKLPSLHNFLFAIPQAAARLRSGYVLTAFQRCKTAFT
jgi:hypothetical protein